MIDPSTIQKLAIQYQTTAENVTREYCQHLFLSLWYQQQGTERILFKGGTALRVIYGSPRFSEDLDFSGFGIRPSAIEEYITHTLSAMERLGLALDIEEAKTTSGGYLGIIHSQFLSYHVQTQLEISLRKQHSVRASVALIAGDFLPAYTLLHLPQELLVEEKLNALLERGKPRDFYDVYFILRRGLLLPKGRKTLAQVAIRLKHIKPEAFQELRVFLPRTQQALLKDFRGTLTRELHRYLT